MSETGLVSPVKFEMGLANHLNKRFSEESNWGSWVESPQLPQVGRRRETGEPTTPQGVQARMREREHVCKCV